MDDKHIEAASASTEVGHEDDDELDDLSWAIVKFAAAILLVGIVAGVLWGK
jgi:hypothetical protein